MTLRRGFKTEANTHSREMRDELGLAWTDPLCPFRTAEHLGVAIRPLSSYRAILPAEATLLMHGSDSIDFSAITGCFGSERVVIYNDGRAPTRVRADIMHELSHMLLIHPPHRVCSDAGGRYFDPVIEEEASWLGPAMLVSEEAALWVVQQELDLAAAAKLYGVSPQLMRMRLNVTGALRRALRAA